MTPSVWPIRMLKKKNIKKMPKQSKKPKKPKKKDNKVTLYDTTLRDGTQAEDISFSVEDKVRITRALDDLGLHYVEGGWPGSNPKDVEYFERMRSMKLKNSRLVAFGSTRRADKKPHYDPSLRALVKAGTPAVTIFGKSWKLHVTSALRVPLGQNLDMIFDSVIYLKKKVDTVFYDAEHFFDGYKDDPEYALKTLRAAEEAGAECLVLCDTNGGTLPHKIAEIVHEVRGATATPIGIHAHNDSGVGVANSIMAVSEGASHVQGTINGFGERCGNADLVSVIPALALKMDKKTLRPSYLKKLSRTSRFIFELANFAGSKHQPYVGSAAFAHKGGIHVSAVERNPETYEHVDPVLVGNRRRVLVSDLSGRANLINKAREFGIKLDPKSRSVKRLLDKLKMLEHAGYQFEGAEASFELMMRRAVEKKKVSYFKLLGFKVIEEKDNDHLYTEATIKLEVGGKVEHTAADGNGPVNALDRALRKALLKFYPSLKEVRLIDFKVRVLEGGAGTASKVRVLVESGDKTDKWGTVGVSENVIEASWQALVDGLEYKLYKDEKSKK